MCGLLGGNNPKWQYLAAVTALDHRGPDARRVDHDDSITLGFTRLSVIDTSAAANQPMCSQDSRVRLVFNGEIYGFQSLRSELTNRGHVFRTGSDSEVVLNSWLEWGPHFVDRIDGMFAIAIHDKRTERVHLFRDRPGIKPLYYFYDGKNFAFASELKALQTLCHDVSFSVDNTAVYDFLTYGYIPSPKSLFRNVSKLPPATHLEFDTQSQTIVRRQRYWNLPVSQKAFRDRDQAADRLRELISESVTEQLVADVPVGCFLSGGIDSGIVVANAAHTTDRVKTFSVGFDDEAHSESHLAERTATQFDTCHRTIIVERDKPDHQLSQLRLLYDEPFADTSAIPTSDVSQLAARSVTVALSGDGGDELFGGYRWYRRFQQLVAAGATKMPGPSAWLDRMHNRQPVGTLRRKILGAASMACADELSLYVRLVGGITRGNKQQWSSFLEIDQDYDDCWHYRQFWRSDLPILTRLQYLDFHTYLPDDILTKVDRASMAHSLEVRVPFLKREVTEFAFSLPEHLRYDQGRLKGLLKYAYRHHLPPDILHRRKKGFSLPPKHLESYAGNLRETILSHNHDIRIDAHRLPFRLNNPVTQSEQHSGHADVPGIRGRRA